jgi:hypothetical protein
MAGGSFATSAGGNDFEAKITPIVIISCIMAATGGLMFGYDVGVSGALFFFFSIFDSFISSSIKYSFLL